MTYFNTTDGIKIFFEAKGEGKPIVLIHGWSQEHSVYNPQIEGLSKKYKVIAYDLRGHGRSDRPEIGLTLNRFAVDLRELIDYLKLENIVLAGWSMGASTIFEYAKIYGVEKLQGIILFDMTPKFINDDTWNLGLYNGNYKIENALVDLTTMCDNLKDFLEIFFKKVAPYMTDDMLSASIETAMSNTPHILYAMWLAMASNDYRGILGRLTIPAVIAYGTNESLYSPETACFLNSKIPDSKIVPFENCTHLLVRENPKKATEVIEELSQIVFR